MCKLAHGSAYVDKMFEKLSAKEAKNGTDKLSEASVQVHGKKKKKGEGDTMSSKDTKQAVMSSVFAVQVAVDKIVKGDYANVFVVQRPPGHHLGDEGRALAQLARLLFYEWRRDRRRVLSAEAPRRACDDHRLHSRRRLQPTLRLSCTRLRDSRPAPRERHARVRAEESSIQFVDFPQKDVAGTGSTSDAHRNVINVEFAQDYTYGDVKAKWDELEVDAAIMKFQPNLIIICAGFDAHKNDPMAAAKLTAADFGTWTRAIMSLAASLESCHGRVISFLEGGYDTKPRTAAGAEVEEHLKALANDCRPSFKSCERERAIVPH